MGREGPGGGGWGAWSADWDTYPEDILHIIGPPKGCWIEGANSCVRCTMVAMTGSCRAQVDVNQAVDLRLRTVSVK